MAKLFKPNGQAVQTIDKVLRLCVRMRDGRGKYGWDHDRLLDDVGLLVECVSLFSERIKRPDAVCALGNSGIGLGTTLAQFWSVALVWRNPRSELLSLRGHEIAMLADKSVVMVDSIVLTGRTANDGFVDVRGKGARHVELAVLIHVDTVKFPQKLERIGCKVTSLSRASRHLDTFQAIMQLADRTEIERRVGEESFWRKIF